jgi:predicted dehydrogenase
LIHVGLGRFGRRWSEVVISSPNWRYAGLVTRDEQTLAEMGQRCGVETVNRFTDLEMALQQLSDSDAVLITTPYSRHAEEAQLSLAYGKHVIVEKPLCADLADAYAIESAAAAANRIVMVSEDYRFSSGARTVQGLVAGGEIGTVEFVCVQYFVQHTFDRDDWRYALQYPLLLENSTHHYDLLRFITGREAVGLTCAAVGSTRRPNWLRPTTSVQVDMEGGLLVDFCASWAYPWFRTPYWGNWWIYGTKGGILWNEDQVLLVRDGEKIDISTMCGSSSTLNKVLEEFTDALAHSRRPETDVKDNTKTMEMMVASIESADRGTRVTIDSLRRRYQDLSLARRSA